MDALWRTWRIKENWLQKGKGMDECSPWMWTCLRWIQCYSHMEKELETLEFGTSELAMLISNVLSWWRNKILLEVFPNLEQKRWCQKFWSMRVKETSYASIPNSNNSCKFETFRNDPFICVDYKNIIHWRMQVLHEFHWWSHEEGVGLLHEIQMWNVSTFFEFQSNE